MRPITFLGILAGLAPLISSGAGESFVRAPYVQLATDRSIHIVWRTDADSSPAVRYGQDVKNLDKTLAPSALRERHHPSAGQGPASGLPLFLDAPAETRQFEATISGLEPESTYYYAIFDGGKRLTPEDPSYRFRTNPVPGADRELRFWVVGDSGTGGAAQDRVHQAMLEFTRQQKRPIDLYLHVGDMAYGSGTTKEFTDRFFAMYEPTLRHTVCWPAMGNHEGQTSKGESGEGPYYDAYVCPTRGEAGGLPSGTEAYYSFDYGRVHFIVLDSHDLDRRPTGAMARWLKADLEKTKASWLVADFHHPPYTKGSHDSDKEAQLIEMREHIMPILEGGGVDIVFTGHSHIYERSMLVDGAYSTPTTAEGVILDDGDGDPSGDGPYRKSEGLHPHNGTVQVVAGHGGTGVGRRGTMPIMRRIFVENGSVIVDIKGDTLTGTMLNLDGVVRDTFAVRKSGTVEHVPIANPWQPAPWSPQGGKPKRTPDVVATIIGKGANWAYLAGTDPPAGWTAPNFDDAAWKRGKAGFGYGDEDDQTKLNDMNGNYKTVYLRREFTIPEASNPAKLARRLRMSVSYDDAFIAYLNGVEILRVGIDSGAGKEARGFHPHEANKKFQSFPLRKASDALKRGRNVLAIEAHNANLASTDFTIHPSLDLTK